MENQDGDEELPLLNRIIPDIAEYTLQQQHFGEYKNNLFFARVEALTI